MDLGIFARTWTSHTSLEDIFQSAMENHIRSFQFNLCVAGKETLPDSFDPGLVDKIRGLRERYDIRLDAMSGTFNLLEEEGFEEHLRRTDVLLQICAALEIPVLTLCTGTRSRSSMWTWHEENDTQASWDLMKKRLDLLIVAAQKYQITLGIEPEISNIVSSAVKAKRLLDEMGTPTLKIIMDAANLFGAGDVISNSKIKEAVDILKEDIVLAHAKDCEITDEGISYKAAGKGQIDFGYYLGCLKERGYKGSVILHGLTEDEISYSVNYIRKWIW